MKITERRLRSIIKSVIKENIQKEVLTLEDAKNSAMSYIENHQEITPDDKNYGYITEITAEYGFKGDITNWFVKYRLENNEFINFGISKTGHVAPMNPGAL